MKTDKVIIKKQLKKDTVIRKCPSQFADMVRYNESDNVMIIEFSYLTNPDSLGNDDVTEVYESFSSVVITKDMARNLIINLYDFVTEDTEDTEDTEEK